MTTDPQDHVLRLEAHITEVDRRSRMATVTFAVPLGADTDALAAAQGEACLLGVLLVPGQVTVSPAARFD